MVDRIIPEDQQTIGRTAQAQMNIDPSAPHMKLANVFSNLASQAQDSADKTAVAVAEEKAAQDLSQHPEGIPSLQKGTSLSADAYNTTAKNLYAVRSDTAMQSHLNQLAIDHKDDPTSYEEASREFVGTWVSQINQVDQAMGLQFKAKYDLVTSNMMPDIQHNANVKLLGEIEQGHADAEVTLGQTIEANVSQLYNKDDDGKALSTISVLMDNYEFQLRTSLNPVTNELLYDSAAVDDIMKNKWGTITEEGLLTQIHKLSPKELNDWYKNLSDNTFQAKFYVPMEGAIDVPLSSLMDSPRRRHLLNQVDQEIRSRQLGAEGLSYAQKVALKGRMRDNEAEALNTGGIAQERSISMVEAENLGLTPTQYESYKNKVFTNTQTFNINQTIATSPPLNVELFGSEIYAKSAEGGASANELNITRKLYDEAVQNKKLILEGDGNSLPYVLQYNPHIREIYGGVVAGDVPQGQFIDAVKTYYDIQGVPKTKRDFLSPGELLEWRKKFPDIREFDTNVKPDEPHYSAMLMGAVQSLHEVYGEDTASIGAQLSRQGDIDSKALSILRLPEDNINARRKYAQSLGQEKELIALHSTKVKEAIKDQINEDMVAFEQSIPPGQDGKLTMFREYREAISIHAMGYMTDEGMPMNKAIEKAEADFIGGFNLVDTSNGGTASFTRITPEDDNERKALISGIKVTHRALQMRDLSELNFYPQNSGFTTKDFQTQEELKKVFEKNIRTNGVLRTTSDGEFVKLYLDGSPVFVMGDQRGLREFSIPIDMFKSIPKVSEGIDLTSGGSTDQYPYVDSKSVNKFGDLIRQQELLDYFNTVEPTSYVDSNGEPTFAPPTLSSPTQQPMEMTP